MLHTFGSASVHCVIISCIDSKQVTYSPCEHYGKKEHIILLLFVRFFPSHIGHHLPFIRNTMLTVKSHIPSTERGGKEAVWAPREGEEQWHGLWGGGRGNKRGCFLGLWWLRTGKKGVNTFPPCGVCVLMPWTFTPPKSCLIIHPTIHASIQQCILNCYIFFFGIKLGRSLKC